MKLGGVLRIGGAIALLGAGGWFTSTCTSAATATPAQCRTSVAASSSTPSLPASSPSLSPPRRVVRATGRDRSAGGHLGGVHLYAHRAHILGVPGRRTPALAGKRSWCSSPRSAAIILLAATFLPSLAEHDHSGGVVILRAAGAIVVIAFAGFGIDWSNKYETTATAGGPTTVAIADFALHPPGAHRRGWDHGHLDQQRLAGTQRRRHKPVIRQQPARQTRRRSNSASTHPASTPTSAESIPR